MRLLPLAAGGLCAAATAAEEGARGAARLGATSTPQILEAVAGLALVLALIVALGWAVRRFAHLPGAGKSIVVAPYPKAEPAWRDEAAEKTVALVQAVISETRTIRSGNRIPPKDKLRLFVRTAGPEETAALESQSAPVRTLAGLASLEFVAVLPAVEGLLKGVAGPFEIGLVPDQPADPGAERDRLRKELVKLDAEAAKIERKLENADFVAKAPAAVVEENRARLGDIRVRREKLGQNLARLSPAA